METQINRLKDLYNKFFQFVEWKEDLHSKFDELSAYLLSEQITTNKDSLRTLLQIINYVSNYHIRKNDLFDKLTQVFERFKDDIKSLFSNYDLFNIYNNNKLVLLILVEQKILTIDNDIITAFETQEYKTFYLFFSKEIKQMVDEPKRQQIEEEINKIDPTILYNFEEKRRIGENDSKICEIIRNDSVEEFTKYLATNNLSPKSMIKYSIFETNWYLIKNPIWHRIIDGKRYEFIESAVKNPTLIQYAAFCGSVQIFKYIAEITELESSIWHYAIHGNDYEIIRVLIDKHINIDPDEYQKIIKKSIKYHNNELADYIIDNQNNGDNDEGFEAQLEKYGIQYYNFSFFPEKLNGIDTFNSLCAFGYMNFVKILLDCKDIDIIKIISNNNQFL